MARQEAGSDRALGLYTLCQAYQLTGAAVGGTKLQWDQNYTLGMASQEAACQEQFVTLSGHLASNHLLPQLDLHSCRQSW